MRQPLHIAHFAHTRETPGKGCLLIFRHTRLLSVLVPDDTDNLTFSGVELQYRIAVNIRFGSKADICSAKGHVRFTPESDTKCDMIECPLWAKCGLMHRSKNQAGPRP